MRRAWIRPASALMSVWGGFGIISRLRCCASNTTTSSRNAVLICSISMSVVRVFDVEVMRLAPEIMARGLGFRRDGVEIPHADAAHALAFGRAGAGRRGADVETQERRRREIDD